MELGSVAQLELLVLKTSRVLLLGDFYISALSFSGHQAGSVTIGVYPAKLKLSKATLMSIIHPYLPPEGEYLKMPLFIFIRKQHFQVHPPERGSSLFWRRRVFFKA